MKEPTKAELAAKVAELAEENAQLRDLLAAIHEAAEAAPIGAAGTPDRKELMRKQTMLGAIARQTAPDAIAEYGPAILARVIRNRLAEEPLDYTPYEPRRAEDGGES